ncbi:hypothetical protein ABMA27_006387 [Loxostege sticticalis]|uniref:Integrase catalytic domain-containing protein n=1 Tax=Loxostege sticticalis TaxID=481309 RepID=A0ABR3IIZ4_LOXSC
MFRTSNKLVSKSREKLIDRLESASEHVLSRDHKTKMRKISKSDCAVVKKESIAESHKSSSSEIKRKQLELAAAEARARIEKDLIDKRLQCELAMLEDNSMSSRSKAASCSLDGQSNVVQWLEHSNVQPSPVAAPTATEAAPAPIPAEPSRAPAPDVPVDADDETTCSSARGETVAHVATPSAPPAEPRGPPGSVPRSVSEVLLKVIKVNLSGPKGTVSAYALLDDGASISMIDRDLMRRLFDNGYARELEVNAPSPSPTWYLSHFGVQNPNKPEKLRLVFDCAGKVKTTHTTERTLGLMWHPSDDSFGFKIALERISPDILNGTESPTKAQMLSIIMSVYDIHGFLSPFIIKGKIIFQNVHRSGVEWNCRVQPEEHALWINWLKDLQCLHLLRIPRFYGNAHEWLGCYSDEQMLTYVTDKNINQRDIVDKQMHIFCDASSKAYAAVIYWRFTRADGRVLICFVASKSRVSPLRPVSIPRLELQGALLGARLAEAIQREHKDIQPGKRYFWTDSSTVLQWIRSDPRSYKPYVAHRLGEIDELTKSREWRHVPTASNVADIATREDAPPLTYSSDWFQGPSFLRLPEDQWPKDRKFTKALEDAKCEERSVNLVVENNTILTLPNENSISSWLTLVRATARVLLFIRRCQRKSCNLDIFLMKEAEDLLIKKCQYDSFAAEITLLKQNKQLSRNSRLLQLTPYVDETGIMRVGGRIESVAGVAQDTRRPAILDGKHRITRLLVEYSHRQALHGANELVVNNLRQRYWILKLRPTVRSIASHCLFCRYRRAAPQPQRMGDLPLARLQHNRRPFSYTGKRYCMLFTCLTIRAIHIEVTENLTTDSTIMALRRMAARRGMPQVIISDNGTNLRGADTELKRSVAELDQEAVREAGTIRGVQWRFLAPGAPEMGGSWERMVRTVKSSLKVILKQRAPHSETLLTLLAEVESLVNSRPITYVSNDPSYPEALTPNHFLIGSSSLRKRWRVAQRLTDMFWARWIKEYLPTLLPRQKWNTEARPLRINDFVILVEPNLERNCWRHGIVSATHAGRDGRVRVVDVRTRTGVLRRPVTRVALLAPQDDCSAN